MVSSHADSLYLSIQFLWLFHTCRTPCAQGMVSSGLPSCKLRNSWATVVQWEQSDLSWLDGISVKCFLLIKQAQIETAWWVLAGNGLQWSVTRIQPWIGTRITINMATHSNLPTIFACFFNKMVHLKFLESLQPRFSIGINRERQTERLQS